MLIIDEDKIKYLKDNGWILVLHEPKMQKWVKNHSVDVTYTIYIEYSSDGKHYVNLYSGQDGNDNNCNYFLLRTLKGMLKRYT